jgi:cyclic pyranopterin phosphate synthase
MSPPLPSLPVVSPLADGFARKISYLRISLTDRCNYRCTYCMPESGVELVPREDVLSFEELERLVRVFVRLGVRRVRLTGGEPTVRKDVLEITRRLAAVDGLDEVVMTTNGHRLEELAAPLAAAGLKQINVSVDTLDADKFRAITRRGDLSRVLAGIDAARAAGLPVKLNVVALKGFNDGELGALCDYAWARDATPRFIEWMPMSDGALYAPGQLLTAAEIRAAVERHVGAPLVSDHPDGSHTGPARYWRAAGRGKLGIISAMSEHFCDTCNRVRLSATGQLHACLAYDDATDLRSMLRHAPGTVTDLDVEQWIEDAIRAAVGSKRHGHTFTTSGAGAPRKAMVSIGG